MRGRAVCWLFVAACGPEFVGESPQVAAPEPRVNVEWLDEGRWVLFGEDVGEPVVVPRWLPGAVPENTDLKVTPLGDGRLYLAERDWNGEPLECRVFDLR